MFGFGKKKIRVEFFRSGETKPFVVSDMPVDQLPDTFAVDTTLHINDEDWRVLAAQPVDKAAFRKTGKLQLTLTNAAPIARDAESILFSIATLSDDFPSLVPVASMEDVAVFHEDDWRQVEFISIAHEALIAEDGTWLEPGRTIIAKPFTGAELREAIGAVLTAGPEAHLA